MDAHSAIARLIPLLIAAALLAAPASAAAVTRQVTKTADTNDGVCSVADCSVREALSVAQNTDVIAIPAGTYNLTLGELSVTGAVTIQGAGATTTTINAGAASRVMTAFDQIGPVTISNVTITGGSTTAFGGASTPHSHRSS